MGQMIGRSRPRASTIRRPSGCTELMRDQASTRIDRHLDLAHRQARRAAHIVESLLVFSRPSTARNALLHLTDLLQRTLQLHDIRCGPTISRWICGPAGPTHGARDSNQLTQSVSGISSSNAEQAIREIRRTGHAPHSSGRRGDRVLMTSRDDGVGIPGRRCRIFDRSLRPSARRRHRTRP